MTIRSRTPFHAAFALSLGVGLTAAIAAPALAGNPYGLAPRFLPVVPQSTDNGYYELSPEAMMSLFRFTPPPCAGPAQRNGGPGFGAGNPHLQGGAACKPGGGSGPVIGVPPVNPQSGPTRRVR